MTSPSTRSRGYTVAIIASLVLSTTAPFIRYLTETTQIPSLVLAVWRNVFVCLTLLPILALFFPHLLKASRQNLRYLLAYGFVLALFNSLWTLSVALNGAAVATVLAYCSGAFTALLGWWLLNERLGWLKAAAVILCLAGCVLVAGALDPAAWQANPLGIITGVLAGLMYAIYSLMGRAASQRDLNPWTTLMYTFAFSILFLLSVNLFGGGFIPGAATAPAEIFYLGREWLGWGILFLLAAGPTLAGFGLYNTSLSLLPSSTANLILTSEPVFTTAISYIFLGERLTLAQVGGSVLILGGLLVLRLNVNGRRKPRI